MLKALRTSWHGEEADFVWLTHRYQLACCRAIWRLLPIEASRRGIEVAERWIEGRATREEFGLAEWQAEGAAFFLDPCEYELEDEMPQAREDRLRYEADREARIAPLLQEVEAMPPDELRGWFAWMCRMESSRPASCWRMPLTSPTPRWPTPVLGRGTP